MNMDMDNKKLGVLILIISVLVTLVIMFLTNLLYEKSAELGCFTNDNCSPIESSLSITHLAFGIIGFVFALGVYLIIFNKGDEAIFRRLEENKNNELKDEKFNILLKGLDSFERKVLKAIREQDGITQNTLRIRVDLSKGKLSQVITDLEKKNLIKREKKQKTYSLHFRELY